MHDDAGDMLSLSPLWGLGTPRALAHLLDIGVDELWRLSCSPLNYVAFETRTCGKLRAVNAPRRRLDAVHRRLLDHLRPIDLPDYLHSGRCGRSHLTHAFAHLSAAWLCSIDLRSFYLQVTSRRVHDLFSVRLRCAPTVAHLLTRVCTIDGHLPIGARISQPLAFLVAQPMLDDLERLAIREGLLFTAYVDDLCFSGARATPAFLWRVKQVIHRHGFQYHHARCHGPGEDRTVTGVLLSGDRALAAPCHAARIRRQMAALPVVAPDRNVWLSLRGRVAFAASVDTRCEALLRHVARLAAATH